MDEKIIKLGELLPEGLDEVTMNKIVNLISETIQEEVTQRIKLLGAKSVAFIRHTVDSLKEQAEAELTEENDLYQDAIQFRKLKTVLGVSDKIVVKEQKEDQSVTDLIEENKVLVEQLGFLVKDNDKYKNLYRKYKNQVAEINEQLNSLNEQVDNLKDEKKPFKSNEKALMLSEGNVGENKDSGVMNSFLTDEILALMPGQKK